MELQQRPRLLQSSPVHFLERVCVCVCDFSVANLRPLSQEQFVFIHDALAEAIVCGETEVAAEHLHRYVDELLKAGQAGRTRLEKQFKVS